jgi:hypothetical protein
VAAQHQLIEQIHHCRIARLTAGELTQLDQRLLGGQKGGHAQLLARATKPRTQPQGVGAFTFGQVAPLNFLAMRWLPTE